MNYMPFAGVTCSWAPHAEKPLQVGHLPHACLVWMCRSPLNAKWVCFCSNKHGIHKWNEVVERDNLAMGYGGILIHGQMVCVNACMALMTSWAWKSDKQLLLTYKNNSEGAHTCDYTWNTKQTKWNKDKCIGQFNIIRVAWPSMPIYIDGVGVVVLELWTQCVDYC